MAWCRRRIRANARGIGAVLRASRPAGDRPVADDRAARRLEPKNHDRGRRRFASDVAGDGGGVPARIERHAPALCDITEPREAARRTVRRSWRRASRLSHAQGAGGHFSGTEISPKNRSGALTCRRSQKLRIDAARKIETIREKCRRRAPKTSSSSSSSSRGDFCARHVAKRLTALNAPHLTSCAVYLAHWSTPQTLCTNSSRPLSAR